MEDGLPNPSAEELGKPEGAPVSGDPYAVLRAAFNRSLRACPFCGGPASLSTGRTGGKNLVPMQYVECDHCGATAGWSTGPGEAEAAWNQRI